MEEWRDIWEEVVKPTNKMKYKRRKFKNFKIRSFVLSIFLVFRTDLYALKKPLLCTIKKKCINQTSRYGYDLPNVTNTQGHGV